jgi:hypothetical protein
VSVGLEHEGDEPLVVLDVWLTRTHTSILLLLLLLLLFLNKLSLVYINDLFAIYFIQVIVCVGKILLSVCVYIVSTVLFSFTVIDLF